MKLENNYLTKFKNNNIINKLLRNKISFKKAIDLDLWRLILEKIKALY
tara:strand:+ start:5433 stop:5576 length:144 start_codon:yes stop_codon:yes gene_type:complete